MIKMKKSLIILATCLIAQNVANAQISTGGFPWSVQQNIQTNNININEYALPNFESFKQ